MQYWYIFLNEILGIGTPRAESAIVNELNATATDEIIDDREIRKTHDLQTTMDFAANIEKVKEVNRISFSSLQWIHPSNLFSHLYS